MFEADLVLLLLDAVQGAGAFEEHLIEELTANKVHFIPCLNKIDLQPQRAIPAGWLGISAKNGAGLEALYDAIRDHGATDAELDAREDAITARRRHLDALTAAEQSLERALACCRSPAGSRDELIAEELCVAQQSLALMTGEYGCEDLLGDIFSQFCVGK